MGRYTGPKHKLARREGINLLDKTSNTLARRLNIPPGQHGRKRKKRTSEYGTQLREKQKAKVTYGIMEKQFKKMFKFAENQKEETGELLVALLETRLDNVVYRLGFPNKLTFREAHTRLLFLTYLPAFLQPYYIKLFRRNPLPDNNLHFYGYFDLQWMLQQIKSQGRDAHNAHWQIIEERGMSQSRIKNAIKRLLKALGLSYKAFLPQILVVLEKKQYE
jgi:hypothetical protein